MVQRQGATTCYSAARSMIRADQRLFERVTLMMPQATGSAKRGRLLGRVARDGRPLLEMARLGVPSRERGHAAAISLRSERACRRYGGDAIRCGAPGNGRDIARSRWDWSHQIRGDPQHLQQPGPADKGRDWRARDMAVGSGRAIGLERIYHLPDGRHDL